MVGKRDYISAPLSDQLGLGGVIAGLVSDLELLRAGKIAVNDAIARSMLAKQIFNGVRIYMNGAKMLSEAAVRADLPAAEGAVVSPAQPLAEGLSEPHGGARGQ